MPRKRRPDQGPPIPRIRNACLRCKEKRYKCSEERPCSHCTLADVDCVTQSPRKRKYAKNDQVKDGTVTTRQIAQDDIERCASHETVTDVVSSWAPISGDSVAQIELSHATIEAALPQVDAELQTLQVTRKNDLDRDKDDDRHMDVFLATPIFLSRPSTPMASSLLEMNPAYKELWYHYTEVLSCLHSPHDVHCNPIVKVLSPVAQSFDPLLAVLLASSLENYRSLRGLPPDEELLGSLMGVAISGVQQALSGSIEGKISELTLATVIALCDFEIVARKRATASSWRIHLEGAKRIIMLHGGPRKQQKNSDFYSFLLKWLAYFDVMSSVTSIDLHAEPLFAGKYWLKSDTDGIVLEDDFRLDPYMGFLQDVIPSFLEVGRLTRERRKLTSALNLREANELHLRCRVLEHTLRDTLGTVSGQRFMSDAKARILISCHDAFVFAIMIHLYRRVEGLPSNSADVRTCVTLGLSHIASSCILDATEIDSSLLFPLFTFGCEAESDADRAYVLDRMTALGALGLGNVDRAIEVLASIWSPDTDMSEIDWDQILRMFNWEVNLA